MDAFLQLLPSLFQSRDAVIDSVKLIIYLLPCHFLHLQLLNIALKLSRYEAALALIFLDCAQLLIELIGQVLDLLIDLVKSLLQVYLALVVSQVVWLGEGLR